MNNKGFAISTLLYGLSILGLLLIILLMSTVTSNRINTREYVPISAIRRMNSQYTEPTLEEGFSKIYIYNPNNIYN